MTLNDPNTRLDPRYHYYANFHIDYASSEINLNLYSGRLHMHNISEVVIVERGVSTIIIDQHITKAKGAFAIFCPANIIHQQLNEYQHPYSRYCVSIDPSYFSRPVEIPRTPFVLPLSESELSRLVRPAALLLDLTENQPTSSENLTKARRESLLTLILAELADIRENSSGSLPSSNSYLCEVCRHIERNIASKITIDDLAAKFFVCRAKLTRDFRAGLGMSVGEYITMTRVGKSKLLLINGLGLEEIASRCGFADPAHYIRTFQRLCGETPAAFRKKAAPGGISQKNF